jgi:hypothetical protein
MCLPPFFLGPLRDLVFEMTVLVVVHERAEGRLVEFLQHVL